MFVLDNNNGRNDTPQLSYNTKYDKLILTSDFPTLAGCPGRSVFCIATNTPILQLHSHLQL